MEDLITLRGVARKTANIVLGNSFGIVEGIAVDTHVNRLAHRLGFSDRRTPTRSSRTDAAGPAGPWFDFTYVLIDHGPRALHGEEAELPRVPGRAAVPGQPGVSAERPARPMVVAHRGASVEQPENTIAAFEAAIDAGADAVEFDVRMTADGDAVVMHDPDVSRTTDGTGVVSEMTLEETGSSACRRWRRRCDASPVAPPSTSRSRTRPTSRVHARRGARGRGDALALDEVAFAGQVIVSSFNGRSPTAERFVPTFRPAC